LELFDGPHSWPPETVCANALSWLLLQAMRHGRLAVNKEWIDSVYLTTVSSIDSTERVDPYAAYLLYQQAGADFANLHDIKKVGDAAGKLAQSDAVKRTARRTSELAAESQTALERED